MQNRHKKYSGFMKWLVADVGKVSFFPIFSATVLEFAAQGLMVGSLLLALQYAKMINAGDNAEFLHWSVDFRTSTFALFVVAISIMVVFGVGSICGYLSRKLGFNVRRKYTEHCTNRALELIGNKELGSNDPEVLPLLLKVVRIYPIYCGRMANQLASAVAEVLVFGITFVSILVLEPLLTIVLAAVSGIGFFFIYRSSVRGAVDSSLCDRFSPKVNKCLVAEIRGRLDGSRANVHFSNPDWGKWLGYYIGRVSIVEVGGLVAGLIAAVLFAVLLIGLVSDVMNDGSWERVIVYLVLFRVNAVHFRKLIRRITAINRFYPQSHSYWNAITTKKLSKDGSVSLEDLELEE